MRVDFRPAHDTRVLKSCSYFLVLLTVMYLRAPAALCVEEYRETCKFLNSSNPWKVGVAFLSTRFPQENTKLAFPSAAVMFSLGWGNHINKAIFLFLWFCITSIILRSTICLLCPMHLSTKLPWNGPGGPAWAGLAIGIPKPPGCCCCCYCCFVHETTLACPTASGTG